MHSSVCGATFLLGLLGCCRSAQAFLAPLPSSSTAAAAGTTAYNRQRQLCSLPSQADDNNRLCHSATRSRAALLMSPNGSGVEEGPKPEQEAVKSPTELMNEAAEADFVARASASSGGMMGPAMQPEEDKKKEKDEKKAFELEQQKNTWASGAFKRGLALQAVVLLFVVFLSFQPEEVGNLAICAPFTHGPGCVGFGEWVEIVFFGAPIPTM